MSSRFVDDLKNPGPLWAVELRPPRSGLVAGPAMETWIDLGHAARSLARRGTYTLLTDSAVGDPEEENLRHLAANMTGDSGAGDAGRLVPFLTCKHSLDYCLLFADRAARHGVQSLTVVGGDASGGVKRCLPHAFLLRQRMRAHRSDLALGGWVNPHRDPTEQVGFVEGAEFAADYLLTQVVSHHLMDGIEGWLNTAARSGVDLPTAWGVFYYRNGDPAALRRLAAYFPVPVESVAREFDEGGTPELICARTIVALARAGVENVYLCNLGTHGVGQRLDRIQDLVTTLA